ncbi:MAG TPA: putative Ig domain-containing protein [Candidatus Eisenbacteria bacterium]|nr:putative Ig domain-containing protein [Candidatus Eisenbacteria bacterium]
MFSNRPHPCAWLALRRHVAGFLLSIGSILVATGAASAAMPGDTLSVVTLQANFDADNPNAPPNSSLPGAPTGDYLMLTTEAGSVTVVPSYDGLSRPVEVRQLNVPGVVSLDAHPASIPAPAEKVTVRWSSVAKDDEAIILMDFAIRASNGATLASVDYLHQGQLSYNGFNGAGQLLPVLQPNRVAQQFTVDVDFLTRTTSLAIDGTPVPGFQAVPFAESGDDVALLSCNGEGGHPQTMYVDNLSMVARYRVPDRGPAIAAPATVTQSENSPIAFTVTASDPDGEAIASLTSSSLPLGASFTPNASNTSGAFAWTPDFMQSGGYSITFTAANALSASATTAITVLNVDRSPAVAGPSSVSGSEASPISFTVSASDPDGDAVESLTAAPLPAGASFSVDPGNTGGTFAWTPAYSDAGSYSVTFTATAGGLSGSLLVSISVSNQDRAPVVSAPIVVDGEEGGILDFNVSASDPDADPVADLTADLSALPIGHDATFTPSADHLSGTLHWPMKHGEAGSYDVAFTASNGLSGSAVTKINVAFAGTSVTGELIWTPQPGEEGTYTVTFTATNNLGETGSADWTIVVTSPLTATAIPLSAPRLDGRQISLSPDRALKGPIVSVTGLSSASTGTKTTTSATATDTGTALLAAALGGVSGAASTSSAAKGIIQFDADLSGLPIGHDAVWTVDQDPVVTAPAAYTVDPGTPLSFAVGVSDPDGDAMLGLTADLSVLPAGNTATFSSSAPFTSGSFSWTPRAEDAGTYAVVFTGFNALVGHATTTITVRAIAPARIYTVGAKKIRLSSNKAFGCMQLEPVNDSFSLFDVDLATIKMISYGTGSVSEISANSTKSAVIGDRDNNQVQDMQICFEKGDLRNLFSLLRGSNSVPVLIQGRLLSGSLFQGSVTLEIVAGGGALQTVMSPNPLNPSGTLSFITRTTGAVRVSLYDLNGRLVRTLLRQEAVAPGAHEVTFEARDSDGRTLSSGVYFYRIESRDGVDTGRFTVLK